MGRPYGKALGGAAAGVVALLLSSPVYALPADGDEDESLLAGVYTLIFDTLPGPDVDGTDEGIIFNYSDFTLTVTNPDGDNEDTVQDVPADGGLGLYGTSSDNLEVGERLKLTFSTPVHLDAVSFNGSFGSDGHTNLAQGIVEVEDGTTTERLELDTTDFVSTAGLMGTMFWFAPKAAEFGEIGFLEDEFAGYIEALQVRVKRQVPEPTSLGLLGAGLLSLGFIGRRRRKTA